MFFLGYSDGEQVTMDVAAELPERFGIFEISPMVRENVEKHGWHQSHEGKHELMLAKTGTWPIPKEVR